MIEINDNDLPITAAAKIINGKKPNNLSEAMRNATSKLFGISTDTQDMFDLDEIKEIADYLMIYYNAHNDGG